MTMAGSVGSVEMPQVYPTPRDHTPTGVYSSTGNGGCRTIYRNDATAAPYGYHSSTQRRGEAVAHWAALALRGRTVVAHDDDPLPPGHVLRAARERAARARRRVRRDPRQGRLPRRPAAHRATRPGVVDPPAQANEFKTDVVWYRIGDADFVSAPGELFPFTYARDFGGPADQAVPDGASPPPWIMSRLSQRYRFVEGLGEDMVGYLFPKTNAVGVPRSLDGADDTDRFGCGHSDDGEAAGRRRRWDRRPPPRGAAARDAATGPCPGATCGPTAPATAARSARAARPAPAPANTFVPGPGARRHRVLRVHGERRRPRVAVDGPARPGRGRAVDPDPRRHQPAGRAHLPRRVPGPLGPGTSSDGAPNA